MPPGDHVAASTSIGGLSFSAIGFAVLVRIEIPHRLLEHILRLEEGHAGSNTDRKISRRSGWPEINRARTWTFQRFSAAMEFGGRYRGGTPASRRHKTWI